MKRIYVDSCVYISYLTNEMNFGRKSKGQNYQNLFELFLNKKYTLVISRHVIFEIKKFLKKKNIEDQFIFIKNLIKEIKGNGNLIIGYYDKEDELKAKQLDNNNFPDALHLVLALKYNCSILTTEDKHFLKFNDLIEIKHPKEFELE